MAESDNQPVADDKLEDRLEKIGGWETIEVQGNVSLSEPLRAWIHAAIVAYSYTAPPRSDPAENRGKRKQQLKLARLADKLADALDDYHDVNYYIEHEGHFFPENAKAQVCPRLRLLSEVLQPTKKDSGNRHRAEDHQLFSLIASARQAAANATNARMAKVAA